MQSNMQHSALVNYCLHLADTTLILSHRNSEWCGHGPILEQDIALTNIALDLLGQARNFYQYAANLLSIDGKQLTEDNLAYLREPNEYKNYLLVEQPNEDWAVTMLRQFYFSSYQYFYYTALQNSKDEQLAAIATKALKEITYHLKWSSEWVVRLGDGTAISNQKMTNGINVLKDFIDELFVMSDDEIELLNNAISIDIKEIQQKWQQKINDIFNDANLKFIASNNAQFGGKKGTHSTHLTTLLNEMQELQRTYPNSTW